MVSALTPHGGQPSTNKSTSNPILEAENANKVPLASPESPSDINEESLIGSGGGGEAPACPNDMLASLQTSPESEEPSSSSMFAERGYTKLSSLPHGLSPTSVMAGAVGMLKHILNPDKIQNLPIYFFKFHYYSVSFVIIFLNGKFKISR